MTGVGYDSETQELAERGSVERKKKKKKKDIPG